MAGKHEECGEKMDKILLFLTNNEIFVWDKDAVMQLRKKHRIVGSLVGSLPSKPRQNLVFSLPLVLLPEEAWLLIDKDIARIVESDMEKPAQETIEKFQEEREISIQQQIERLEEMKQQKLEDFAEIIEEGREKTNRKRKRLSQDFSRKQQRNGTDTRKPSDDTQKQLEHTRTQTDEIQKQMGDIWMQTEDTREPSDSSRKQSEDSCTSPERTKEPNLLDSTLVCVSTQSGNLRTKDIDWKFPKTKLEQARCKVFLDLWEKGYFLTNGNKFGGDYLVYPGDPLRFHSHFIVKILPSEQKLTGSDLVTVGRLGSTVKKTSVLASVDSSGKVIYTSVQWSGFP